eukprot:TRINITY_DN66312_c0_g1_i1.p1 TRINITY_DN66312_c0_g1~~TRINITY_DN66312_c0_g1_i1.p1  ORF type:complete len:269 (-),score=42.68 TRINITY_DN66312_c0_g1_i1:57-863(-)
MVKDAIGGDAKVVGAAAAASSMLQAVLLLPVNSLQTRMQAGGLGFTGTLKSVFACGSISGFRQLYAALPPTVAMLGMRQGLIFGSGAHLKKQLPGAWPEWTRDITSMGLSAFVCTTFLFPLDTMKTRLQLARPLPSFSPSQWYHGFWPALGHAVIGRPLWLVLRNGLERTVPDPERPSLAYWKHFMCGGLTGTVVCVVVFPLDTLKKRLQASDKAEVSVANEVKTLLGSGGLRRFYSGISVKLFMNFTQGAVFNTIFVVCSRCLQDLT